MSSFSLGKVYNQPISLWDWIINSQKSNLIFGRLTLLLPVLGLYSSSSVVYVTRSLPFLRNDHTCYLLLLDALLWEGPSFRTVHHYRLDSLQERRSFETKRNLLTPENFGHFTGRPFQADCAVLSWLILALTLCRLHVSMSFDVHGVIFEHDFCIVVFEYHAPFVSCGFVGLYQEMVN